MTKFRNSNLNKGYMAFSYWIIAEKGRLFFF